MQYIETIWNLMNTPIGLSVCGFILIFCLNKLFSAKPGWAKYEGFMISAVKQAEKWIPNDTENQALSKADKALEYFINAYEKGKGKSPSIKMKKEVMLGMSIVHDKLEQSGTLKSPEN